ncbi:MAG: O-antigen ligase family protein [Gemmatimonadota bacterium]|nr:O-antigen ligase family protein [Gemmatimonadota bacterium]
MTSVAYGALWFFTFALPWENIIVIPGVGTISRLAGMLALGLAVLAAVVSGRFRRWRFFQTGALLFVIWSAWNTYGGGYAFYGDYEMMTAKFRTYVQLLAVLWMIWELAPNERRVRGLLVAFVAGAAVASLNTIFVYRTQGGTLSRFAAVGFDPNDLAATLALALPMAWYLSITYRHPVLRWASRLYLPLAFVAIGLTGSRGGVLAAFTGLLIVPATTTRLSAGRIAMAAITLVASAALALAYIPDATLQRIGSTRAEVEEGTMNGRLRIWKAGVEALVQEPLIGYGTGGFDRAVRPILRYGQVAHNTFLQVIVEQGILGFVLWLLMYGAAFQQVLTMPLLQRRFGYVVLATLGVVFMPLTWDNQKAAWVIPALLVGLAAAVVRANAAATAESPRRPAMAAARPMRPARPIVVSRMSRDA